jgi:hypothetical protein
MNDRERFQAIMHYRPVDRPPICDFSFWSETIVLWRDQGLPDNVTPADYYYHLGGNADEFFGMDYSMDRVIDAAGLEAGLMPAFEEKVIEDRGDAEVIQQTDGVRVLRHKFLSSIPQHQGYLLVDRESWRKHYKPRLDPAHPGRYPADWDERVKVWKDSHRSQVIGLNAGSLYGWIRNWNGVENLSLIVYDDPAWFEEMVTTVTDCIIGTLTRALVTGGHFDAAFIWEDMAYRAGPLLGPHHFKKFLVPQYRRLTDLLHKHGVDIICVDCDGKIDLLVPLWLEAGVNCIYPIEIGTWGADPLAFRKQYGKEMLMMGGFDKHILARTKQEIEQEIYRLAPLVEEGGFIPFCDHRVPPDVPLDNYLFYLETVRRAWGRNVNLRPMQKLAHQGAFS